MAVLEDRTLPP